MDEESIYSVTFRWFHQLNDAEVTNTVWVIAKTYAEAVEKVEKTFREDLLEILNIKWINFGSFIYVDDGPFNQENAEQLRDYLFELNSI